MTLLPRPSDAQLVAMKADMEAKLRRAPSGVVLGPGSPLLPDPAPRAKPMGKHERAVRRGAGPSEHDIQVKAFERINDPAEVLRRPALALVHAVPNGGHRTVAAAKKAKAEGQKPGVPDIDCPVARGGYCGLRIEVKKPGGTMSPEQADWMAALAREGRKVAVHETPDGIWWELVAYLDSPRTVV